MTTRTERIPGDIAASVLRRNGAWLVLNQDPTGDTTCTDLVDAASSLRTAKRVARQGAVDIGFEGPWRWRQEHEGLWHLEATWVNEYEVYEWDEIDD